MLFNLIPVYWNWVIQMQRFFYLLLKPQVLRTNCKCLQNILSVISTAKHYIIFGTDVFFNFHMYNFSTKYAGLHKQLVLVCGITQSAKHYKQATYTSGSEGSNGQQHKHICNHKLASLCPVSHI